MHARVFDIDGTLLESFETDCDLFVLAVKRVLGVTDVNTDWSCYRHVTDQGILLEIMNQHGIAPSHELMEATKQEFVSLLEAHVNSAGPFREVPGARDFVSSSLENDRYFVAYATGAWKESALVKLKSAGFPIEGIRLSTSSEFEDRVSIMRAAIAGMSTEPATITYYGDGIWDRAASSELGWQFVPVGTSLGGVQHFNEIAE